ncbi:45800_t:CDS:1, partial [Gigaspora margarita]
SENQKTSQEPNTGLRRPSELADSTNDFRWKDLSALNIHYGNGAIEMFEDTPDFLYNTSLLLRNAKKEQLFNAWDNDSLTEGWNNEKRSLARYMSNVLLKERSSAEKRERVTDSFVNFLLGVLKFNEYPLSLELKADCYFKVHNKKVTSETNFSIWKGNPFVIIDEDKHLHNVIKSTLWGECQIAGELLASAFVNHEEIQGRYRFQSLFAIHVIGTQFTFYRAKIGFNYLNNLSEGFPNDKMRIYRYPVYQDTKQILCFDYTDPDQRKKILDILIKIKIFVIQNKTIK